MNPPASRLRRFGAALLDWLVYAAVYLVLLLLGSLARNRFEGSVASMAVGVALLSGLAIYQMALIASTGQSLGKRWLRIEILRTDDGPAGFVRGVALRTLAPSALSLALGFWLPEEASFLIGDSGIPFAGQLQILGVFGLVDVLMIFTPASRCLHDYLAGTKVVVGYAVPVRVRHLRLALISLLLAPPAVALAATASFSMAYVKSCIGPHADCDGKWLSLCEADLTSLDDCGACGNTCGDFNAAASCVDGACVIACEPGFFDCDGKAATGCESEIASDSRHCGSCANDCDGAPCQDGVCGPKEIGWAWAFVVDEEAVYALGGGILKYPLAGGDAVTLVPRESSVEVGWHGSAIDAERIYWADFREGRVSSVAKTGGRVTTLVDEGMHSGWSIWLIGDALYWLRNSPGPVVMKVPTTGGARPAVAIAGASVAALGYASVADPSGLYWGGRNALWAWPIGLGTPKKVLSPANVTAAMAVDATHLYWNDDASVLMSVAKDGGAPTTLLEVGHVPWIVVDDQEIFWTQVSGKGALIMRMPKKGGPAEVVAPLSENDYLDLAQNSTHLFWRNQRNRVFSLAKKRK